MGRLLSEGEGTPLCSPRPGRRKRPRRLALPPKFQTSLRSKRPRKAKSKERGFRPFSRAENGARAKIGRRGESNLLPNRTKTLATQAKTRLKPHILSLA